MVNVYRVRHRWQFDFHKIAAEKVTKSSVVVQGHRQAKFSEGTGIFESFDEAKEYAIRQLQYKAERARKDLELAEYNLRLVEAMTEETIPVSKSLY